MKDVIITEAFDGYPDGVTTTKEVPSPTPVSRPNEYAEMIVGKGLARWPKAKAKTAAKPKRPLRAARPAPPPADPDPEPEKPAEPPATEPEGDDA